MSNQWFRMYSEFLSDPKVQMMNEAYQRRLVMLFCMRCSVSETFHDDAIEFQLRISSDEWKQTKQDFIKRGFIDSDNKLLNWEKRQYHSDSSTNRVKKHREKKVKRFSNVSVTPPEQNRTEQNRTEQIQNTTLAYSRAHAPETDFQKIFNAGCAVNPDLMIKSTAVIYQWLADGITPEDAVPEVSRLATKAKSWGFFTGAVSDAKATRLAPMPLGVPKPQFKSFEQQARDRTDLAIQEVLRNAQPN